MKKTVVRRSNSRQALDALRKNSARRGRTARSGRGGVPAWGRLIAIALAAVIVVSLGVLFVPRLIHHCDRCDALFFGTGYKPNVVSGLVSAITGSGDGILCRDCALQEHAIALGVGKSLEDYKRPLFGD